MNIILVLRERFSMGAEMSDIDVVGVGVGPANLSLVTAMLEARDCNQLLPSAVFLERLPNFGWHPGMMLPDSQLQVPFLKDLATQRNPCSKYTFLNFLFEHGRLEEFINLREFYPRLREFSTYMSWVAAQAAPLIRYAVNVTDIRPAPVCDGRVARIEVVATDGNGQRKIYRARAVVLATGCRPVMPAGAPEESEKVIHTSSLLKRVEAQVWSQRRAQRFLVVGGGQSAAEAACFLLREFPLAHVELAHHSYAFHALDDNPFINKRYFAHSVDAFHALDEPARCRALSDLSASNFGVADRRLLDELYRYHYEGISSKRPRISFLHGHELIDAKVDGQIVQCRARDLFSQTVVERKVDGLIVATGYRETAPVLLRSFGSLLLRDALGRHQLRRDYRIESTKELDASVFMHGARQDTHGPGEYSLSVLAQRAAVLFDALQLELSRTG